MTRVSRVRTALVCTSIAALTTLGVSACQGHANDTTSAAGTLTIQGDAGDPTLTENFNPFSTTQLEGTRLIYEPLEIAELGQRIASRRSWRPGTRSPTRRRWSSRCAAA